MSRHLVSALAGGFLVVMAACRPAPPTEEPAQPVGTAIREADIVEHVDSAGAVLQIDGQIPLFEGDGIRVRDGGESILDFGDGLRIRVFNDSALNVVSVEAAEDAPLEVRLFLEEGGFTGELTEAGGQAIFETPDGAQIRVLGTEFFVAYDPATATTYAGNFHGTIEVSSDGEQVAVPDGMYVHLGEGDAPGTPAAIPGSVLDLEGRTRDLGSVPEALEIAPTDEPTPSTAPTEEVCTNRARFVEDVTIPDGTIVPQGEPFTKIWRITNDGTCTWTEDYTLFFSGGWDLDAQREHPLPEAVPPGESLDLSVDMVAPRVPNTYEGQWMLRTPEGERFGVGRNARTPLWVIVEVQPPTATPTPTLSPTPTATATPSPTPDRTPPVVVSLFAQERETYYAFCEDAFTVVALVSDSAGVSRVVLEFYYLNLRLSTVSPHQEVRMQNTRGDLYQAVIENNDYPVHEWLNGANGYVEYFVTALDRAGNRTNSPVQQIPLLYCIG